MQRKILEGFKDISTFFKPEKPQEAKKELVYEKLYCQACHELTSHVQVDTIEGKRFSCELCGCYYG